MPFPMKEHPAYTLRDESWLLFNSRVLEEATTSGNPLLEQAKFLSIFSSNLDEFFMVRIAGLAHYAPDSELHYGLDNSCSFDPYELRQRLIRRIRLLLDKQTRFWENELKPALSNRGIHLVDALSELSPELYRKAQKYFDCELKYVLSPVAIDLTKPMPLLRNLALELLVTLRDEAGRKYLAYIELPALLPRFLKIFQEGELWCIPNEVIIREFLPELFPGYKPESCSFFRITRDRDLTFDEDVVQDLISELQNALLKRGRRTIVRLEISSDAGPDEKKFLTSRLDLTNHEVFLCRSMLRMRDLMEIATVDIFPDLRDKPLSPLPSIHCPPQISMFENIRRNGAFFLQMPFESFEPVIQLLQEAASDPDVLAIKQTIYRVGRESPIVEQLIRAARNGKQVTVLFEIFARFDEENNLNHGRVLAEAGANVLYGSPKRKVHAKALLIIRREQEGIRRYVHLSTGNYNPVTAKQYTDIGYFTCDEQIAQDVAMLFNFLTGFAVPPAWNKLIVAPFVMRNEILKRIENEKNAGENGRITMKMNALLDPQIIDALYRAAGNGVKIDLIVRGICTLNPASLPAKTAKNIRIISIVDRFLEHSRIFIFGNHGQPEYFVGSADMMPRNLNHRIELLFPVEKDDLRKELDGIVSALLHDRCKGRHKNSENNYLRPTHPEQYAAERSQLSLYYFFRDRYEKWSRRQNDFTTES